MDMFGLKHNDSLTLKTYINKEIEKEQIRKQSAAKKQRKIEKTWLLSTNFPKALNVQLELEKRDLISRSSN